jgi:hypothetical protein
MRYFLDTEFIEAPGHLDLISIGVVAEDGREFYGENAAVDWSRASAWVLENVRPHLSETNTTSSPAVLAKAILALVGDDPSPEFWGYYADYDWVAFCWLFGSMIDLPKGWPMYCRDLKQLMDECGVNRDALPPNDAHHALEDARWIAKAFAHIESEEAIPF